MEDWEEYRFPHFLHPVPFTPATQPRTSIIIFVATRDDDHPLLSRSILFPRETHVTSIVSGGDILLHPFLSSLRILSHFQLI